MYDKYVTLPVTTDKVQSRTHQFCIAGMPGAVGSMDATHIGMARCPYQLKQCYASFKQDMPSRTYNMIVDHRRRILYSTRGHPGRWNDKTLVLYDDLAMKFREGSIYNDLEFELVRTDRM